MDVNNPLKMVLVGIDPYYQQLSIGPLLSTTWVNDYTSHHADLKQLKSEFPNIPGINIGILYED